MYDPAAKYLTWIETDSRGYTLFKPGTIGADSGGYFTHYFETQGFKVGGQDIHVKGSTFLASPSNFRDPAFDLDRRRAVHEPRRDVVPQEGSGMTKTTRRVRAGRRCERRGDAARAADGPTFSKDVAPILYSNCVVCHRPGRGGADVAHHVSERAAVGARHQEQGRRPRDAAVGRERREHEAGKRSQPVAEGHRHHRALGRGGAPKGEDKDLPAVPTFPAGGWAFGEPDAVIDLPIEAQVPPTGEFPQLSYFVKSPFPTDVWIQKMQVRTNNPAIVHHATLFIRTLPEGTVIKDGRPVLKDEGTSQANSEGGINTGLPPGAVPASGWSRTCPAAAGNRTPTASRGGCRRAPTSK